MTNIGNYSASNSSSLGVSSGYAYSLGATYVHTVGATEKVITMLGARVQNNTGADGTIEFSVYQWDGALPTTRLLSVVSEVLQDQATTYYNVEVPCYLELEEGTQIVLAAELTTSSGTPRFGGTGTAGSRSTNNGGLTDPWSQTGTSTHQHIIYGRIQAAETDGSDAHTRFNQRTVQLADTTLTNIGGSAIRPFAYLPDENRIYGHNNSGQVLHYASPNAPGTWTQVTGVTLGNPVGGTGLCRKMFKCMDGEVLVAKEYSIVKSIGWGTASPAWSVVKSVSTVPSASEGPYIKEWGFDFDSATGVGIATEYANTWGSLTEPTRVWITVDDGDTWTAVLTTGTLPLDDLATHWHGVCYDSYQQRFYVSLGHGADVGLYCRELSGTTWYPVNIEEHKLDHLRSTSSTSPEYSSFTTITPTPQGVYLGTDDFPCAICFVPRGQPVYDQKVKIIFIDDNADIMNWWAEASCRVDSNGIVFLGTKITPSSVQAPRVYAAVDGIAQLVYEYPNAVTTTNTSVRNILSIGANKILILFQINSTDFYTLTADIVTTRQGGSSLIPSLIGSIVS